MHTDSTRAQTEPDSDEGILYICQEPIEIELDEAVVQNQEVQDSDSGIGFRIRAQDMNSGFEIRSRVQDSDL